MEKVILYCDGSSSGTLAKPGPSGAGIILLRGTEEFEMSVPLPEGTNQQAELYAVLKALLGLGDRAKELAVEVYTDSAYVVGLLAHNWEARANLDLIDSLRKAVAACGSFRIQHIPGHSGHALNERAHRLATAARKGEASRANYTPLERTSNLSISKEAFLELETRVEQLVKALSFYADSLCYLPPPGRDEDPPAIVIDRGAVARRVLAALGFAAVEEPFVEPGA